MKLSKQRIAEMIDHTNVDPEAKRSDIEKLCREVKRYGLGGICVRPEWVRFVKQKSLGARIVVLVDDPIGDSPHKKRLEICRKVKKEGGDYVDIVVSIPDVKHARWKKVLRELKSVCSIMPTKVIIGSGFLTDKEIVKVCQIAKKAGAAYVKTATRGDPLEHRELKEKFYHLKLMKKSGLPVKASGKIRSLKDLRGAVKAGASVVGTSSGAGIMEELYGKRV